jgi:2,5-dioxopentanoate dehydrogenase
VNGFPTGVEVCHAIGAWRPVSSPNDCRATSVGTMAIYRFVRPVCYQNFPHAALPEELNDSNSFAIWRRVNGKLTRDAIA